jgi:hypothetical protein
VEKGEGARLAGKESHCRCETYPPSIRTVPLPFQGRTKEYIIIKKSGQLPFSWQTALTFLCSDFRPVLEGHPDIVFAVHRDEVHQAAPQPGIEPLDEFLLPKLLDEVVHLTAPGFAILDGFTGLVVLCLRRFIPADQFVVIPVIIILVLRDPGVLGYELLYLVGQQVQICAKPVPLLFQGFCVSEPFLQQGDAVKYVRFVFDEPVGGPDEGFLDIILSQMWCLAMAFELIVASVDGSCGTCRSNARPWPRTSLRTGRT